MSKFARRRDANEAAIIKALKSHGVTVTQMDGKGVPDLLIGHGGVTYIVEVKQAHGRAGAGAKRSESGLLETQEAWWSAWQGRRPVVVTTAEEALAVVGITLRVR